MENIADAIYEEVIARQSSKRMKIKTLLKQFGYWRRTEEITTIITELLDQRGLVMNPSLMKLGKHWEQGLDDWIYISEKVQKEETQPKKINIQLPENWNEDNWFDNVVSKTFRTEKEVENKFIIPLLYKLGYSEDDRYDAMTISAAHGSRQTQLEIDFALFDEETEELNNQVLLVVEAKKEHRLTRRTELENAQRQVKSYSVWLGCHYGLITDSKTIQVLDLMPNIGGLEIIFECQREELKENFEKLYNLIGKKVLKEYYLNLVS